MRALIEHKLTAEAQANAGSQVILKELFFLDYSCVCDDLISPTLLCLEVIEKLTCSI